MIPLKVGLRAQDIQTGLQDVDIGALSAETKNIRLVGMAERLAIHIRGVDVISDYKKLEYISSQFGIDSLVLPQVLKVLQDLGWVRVDSKESKIIKIEETVPYFSDIYALAGEYFDNSGPTEIERATIVLCDSLATSPRTEQEIRKDLGLNQRDYELILDLGRNGNFIRDYESSGSKEKVLYSPLFWVENPGRLEEIYELLKKFGADRVHQALQKIRDYQGFPLSADILNDENGPSSEQSEIFAEAIRRGLILAPKVNSFKGEKNFAFTPNVGIKIEEKIILEKAMAILACIRYGEHFGSITKIMFPEIILNRLLSAPHRIGPHSEIIRQYAILIGRGIGKIFSDRVMRDRYYFELIATEENLQAVKLAKDLLKVGEALEDRGLSKSLRGILFIPGSYNEAMRTRIKPRPSVQISAITQEQILNMLNDTMDKMRGAY